LDAGCGVGRVAIPLTKWLEGSYEGFDVVPEAITWCQKNITPHRPNFRFSLAKLRNQKYNRQETGDAAEYDWPYEDSSFDFAFAASLFTHLLPDAHENYVQEAARVLRPGGRLLATYFLLNDESSRLQEDEGSRWRFVHPVAEGCSSHFPDSPERAIAYDEDRVRRLYGECGLDLVGVRYGGWCRSVADYHQDVVVAAKSG
jgi:SAM-dependent methyltransferase